MECDSKDGRNDKNDSIRSRYISKLHERVQTKYCDMQKKLERAKSTDTLTNIQEENLLVNKTLAPNNGSLISDDESQNKNQKIKTAILDCAKGNDATSIAVEYEKAVVSRRNAVPIVDMSINEENRDQKIENEFFDMSFKGSLDSLTDIVKDSDDSIEAITPPPKSMSSRICLKIREAKQRRQEKQKLDKDKDKQKKSNNKVEKMVLSNTAENLSKIHKKSKVATVTIALIEATGFISLEDEKPRHIGCRIKLGSDKRKSKMIKSFDSTIKFQELLTFNLYDDDYILDIVVWDKDVKLGSHTIDLSTIENEKTHKMKIQLQDPKEQLIFLLTISGVHDINMLYSINDNESQEMAEAMQRNYQWYRLLDTSDIGWLNVTVYGAKGLSGNDCYCILTIDNERVYTTTDYKTNAPTWVKTFNFKITDITSILEITVYDEKKSEDVGNISIPLLNIEPGQKWYALKESTLRGRAKGNNPRILLEMQVAWNLIKASLRVINPKEIKLMHSEEKLDRHLLARNIARGKDIIMWIVSTFSILKSCFEWQSRKANVVSLICWLFFCYFFKIWFLPLLLLVPFYIYRPQINAQKDLTETENIQKEDKSLRKKIQDLQETIQTIQNFVGNMASLGESIKNLYNFSVPFVSFLAIFLISVIAFIMYIVPLKYILMVWGVNKFTRKIFKPNRVPNSEVLDLLSRIPDDDTLLDCQEIPLEQVSDDEV